MRYMHIVNIKYSRIRIAVLQYDQFILDSGQTIS